MSRLNKIIAGNGTLLPDHSSLVAGSHPVSYSYTLPTASGNGRVLDINNHIYGSFLCHSQLVNTSFSKDPSDLQEGLICYHPFVDTGNTIVDFSNNNLNGTSYDTSLVAGRKGLGRYQAASEGYITVPNVPTQSGSFMGSFYFKPTTLLTSGSNSSFSIISSPDFYGDNFSTDHNFISGYYIFMGWISWGFVSYSYIQNSYLYFQGAPNKNWVPGNYSAYNIAFTQNKSQDWNIQTYMFVPLNMLVGQCISVGVIDTQSDANYSQISIVGKGMYTVDLVMKSAGYSYTIRSNMSMPVTGNAGIKIELKKRGNYIYFSYKTDWENAWISSIYYGDISLWSNNFYTGFQSYNTTSSIAPAVIVDYVQFKKGIKPDGFGQPEAPGTFEITYNETNVSGAIQDRDDSRLWMRSTRYGPTVGTSTFYWDPNQWYLIQYGMMPSTTGDQFVWHINSKQERTILVGSGNLSGSSFITTSGGLQYFNPNETTSSGLFILDEVAHWNRYLTDGEILKLYNSTSQINSLVSTGYIRSYENVEVDTPIPSGIYPVKTMPNQIGFYYNSMYQSAPPPEITVQFQKVSYRIQQNLKVIAWQIAPFVYNIIRCSSGWYANYINCFACSEADPCICLVRGDISVSNALLPSTNITTWRSPFNKQINMYMCTTTTTGVESTYRQLIQASSEPSLISSQPAQNERMVNTNFGWYQPPTSQVTIKEYGSSFVSDGSRVWIKHSKQGRYKYATEDNFSFYTLDFLSTPSGRGWSSINRTNASKFIINDSYSSVVDLDYSRILPSGIHMLIGSSGINESLDLLFDYNRNLAPTCNVYGTRALELETISGVWSPERITRTAPATVISIPSGIADWTCQTKMQLLTKGNSAGQYGGLLVADQDSTKFYQLLVSTSGVCCRTYEGKFDTPAINMNTSSGVWLRLQKNNSNLYFYCSVDYQNWSELQPFNGYFNLVPSLTYYDSASPIYVIADSNTAGHEAYKAFTTTSGNYWQTAQTYPYRGWLQVDFGIPTLVYAYQIRTGPRFYIGSIPYRYDVNAFHVSAANNTNGPWTILDSRTNVPSVGDYSLYPVSGSSPIQYPNLYRYYRLYVDKTQNGYSPFNEAPATISNFILLGASGYDITANRNYQVGPTVISDLASPSNPTSTSTTFDYFKVSSSGGTSFTSIQDDWELLYDGSAVNSQENSGIVVATQVDSTTFKVNYVPSSPLDEGEQIYMRLQSSDAESLKVDYNITDYTQLYISANNPIGITPDSRIGALPTVSGYVFDMSNYHNNIYTNTCSGRKAIITTSGYGGQGGLGLPGCGIRTDFMPINTADWTFHTMLYPTTTGRFELFSISGTQQLLNCAYNSGHLYVHESGVTNISTLPLITNAWSHLVVVKKNGWTSIYYQGLPLDNSFYNASTLSGNLVLSMFDDFYGLADEVVFEKQALWNKPLYSVNTLDEIITYRTVSQSDFYVTLNVIADIHSPVLFPVSPAASVSGVCPASGIVFDILDDFTGVNWNQLLILGSSYTLWSGGTNMTDFYYDRGTLSYEARGSIGADQTNQILYPSGTIYPDSGSWGRRFTYTLPSGDMIDYFDTRFTLTATGTDDVGYLSRFDNLYPNTFSGSYYFDYISNQNIKFGDVFMEEKESSRVDIFEAYRRHFWVDLYDSDYPVTDIDESSCTLTWDDGVDSFTCSGVWFDTYTSSGILYHRMSWDPGNNWDWKGNRAIHLTAESHNNNPTCSVFNRQEYIIYYGWQVNWFHKAVKNQYPDWEFNKDLPIFLSAKTDVFAPSRGSSSHIIKTTPGYKSEFEVSLFAKPRPEKDLKVGIRAQSQYLQYSEEVEVKIYCKDRDGNEATYVWSFNTEAQPSN